MSYDLAFWRYVKEPGSKKRDLATYLALSNGHTPDDLVDILAVEIDTRVRGLFTGLGWIAEDSESWRHSNGHVFQVSYSRKHFRVDCHGLSGDEMNHFIEIANDFSLPLFDPQVKRRFRLPKL